MTLPSPMPHHPSPLASALAESSFGEAERRERHVELCQRRAELSALARSRNISHWLALPDKCVLWLLTRQRYRWLKKRQTAVQRVKDQELFLHQELYDRHLRDLPANNAPNPDAIRAYDAEFAQRVKPLRAQRSRIVLLWLLGRRLEKGFQWYAKQTLFVLFDGSFRMSLVSASLFAVFGFSLWTIKELELAHAVQRAGDSVSVWMSESTKTPARAESLAPSLPAEAPHFVTLLPQSGIPIYWQQDHADFVRVGIEGARRSVTELTVASDVCDGTLVLAFGTASLEGSDGYNRRLARARALSMSALVSKAGSACNAPPNIIAVAMWKPTALIADPSQRMAFIVAAEGPAATSLMANPIERLDQVPLDRRIANSRAEYSFVEVCRFNAQALSCAWNTPNVPASN